MVTAGVVALGPWALAVWMATCSIVSAADAARHWRAGRTPLRTSGLLVGAVVVPLAAAAGRVAFSVALLVTMAVAVLPARARLVSAAVTVRRGGSLDRAQQAALATVGLATGLGLVGGALVSIERASVTSVCVLLTLACLYDASRYVVGTGAPASWEGTAAGVATVGSAALCVSVLQPTPVTGAYPWLLGVVVAVAGAVGPRLVATWTGWRHPAGPVARLGTLAVVAPLWLLVSTFGRF